MNRVVIQSKPSRKRFTVDHGWNEHIGQKPMCFASAEKAREYAANEFVSFYNRDPLDELEFVDIDATKGDA